VLIKMTSLHELATSLNQIADVCEHQQPDLIYVAIGCAQGHYPPGSPMESPQEYPPFVAQWPGRRVCILIDPNLEEPLRCLPETTRDPNVTVLPLRECFEWPSKWPADAHKYAEIATCQAFLDRLITLAIRTPRTYLIVQDYAGNYIDTHYPIDRFDRHIINKVFYDVTGRDGGCFIDFSKIRIARNAEGHFIQPAYTPLQLLRIFVDKETFDFHVTHRHQSINGYICKFYRISQGLEEPRDWCTQDIVDYKARSLFVTHGVSPSSGLLPLLKEVLFDFCATAEHFMTEEDVMELIHGPVKQFQTSLSILRNLATAELS